MWLRVSPPATVKEATARHMGQDGDVPLEANQSAKKTRCRGPLRTTPLVLISRSSLKHWDRQVEETTLELSDNARLTLNCLTTSGASFFTEILSDTGLSPSTCEEALGELVSLGLVSSDSFMGLRGLLLPASLRKHNVRQHRGGLCTHIEEGGRWFRLPQRRHAGRSAIRDTEADTVEHIARVLLRRYGIVFRALLVRESGVPSWRELVYVYRRLEARGEIRGGRFVEGFAGEQFALPDAVGLLRKANHKSSPARFVILSAADPLNLVGIVLPGDRVPAIRSNRILYRDGAAVATLVGGMFLPMIKMDSQMEESARTLLIKQNISNFRGSLSPEERDYQSNIPVNFK